MIIGTLVSNTPVAYAFARIDFPGRDALFVFVLATMMLPYQVTMIPIYLFFNDTLGWGDTFLPLIIPAFFANAWDVFLLRQFFKTIPEEMCDAARVDGANEWQIFTRIVLPLSKAVLAAVTVFTFLFAWNDFTGPLLFLHSPRNFHHGAGLAGLPGTKDHRLESTDGGVHGLYAAHHHRLLLRPEDVYSRDQADGFEGIACAPRWSAHPQMRI